MLTIVWKHVTVLVNNGIRTRHFRISNSGETQHLYYTTRVELFGNTLLFFRYSGRNAANAANLLAKRRQRLYTNKERP